jgi:hypothetical protein
VGLSTIEATLAKAGTDAELIDEPVIAYFIDMAIAEVRRKSQLLREAPRRRCGQNSKDVMQVID